MKTNEAGISLIKEFEGLRLNAYLDPVGIPTIGYGHTKNVSIGSTITIEQADAFLRQDLADAEEAVERLVHVTLNPNEFSALVSLAYNIGGGAFAGSTLLKRLNAGDRIAAADQFSVWRKGRVRGQLVVLPGLVRRRAAEKTLFVTPPGPIQVIPGLKPETAVKAEKVSLLGRFIAWLVAMLNMMVRK